MALTVYGDLEVSIIDQLPPGRSPVRTQVYSDQQRETVYRKVKDAVQAGRQAYVVFPLVEESDKESMSALRDAVSEAEALAQGPLEGVQVGLLHGRMSGDDKDRVMRAFASGSIEVLVATTVIEVGIDVPNATVMVIEHRRALWPEPAAPAAGACGSRKTRQQLFAGDPLSPLRRCTEALGGDGKERRRFCDRRRRPRYSRTGRFCGHPSIGLAHAVDGGFDPATKRSCTKLEKTPKASWTGTPICKAQSFNPWRGVWKRPGIRVCDWLRSVEFCR